MKNIILIGFMGAGKTTIGQEFAKKFEMEFLDTDEQIEKEQNCTIRELFSEKGEAYFRCLETELLGRLADCENTVVSVGGGLPIQEENHVLLRELGTSVYLKAARKTLVDRLQGDTSRPLLQGGELEHKITDLMQKRETIYERVADKIIVTDQKSPEQIISELAQWMVSKE